MTSLTTSLTSTSLNTSDPQYPNETDHRRRWNELAREIAQRADTVTDEAEALGPPETPGELVILGSGIEAVGFTVADEIRIREADYVFYCVADPATKVWIKQQRPDAYDLYVLYDDSKKRYLTYMQMTEAMLHHVRRGKKVAAIFYGHPGVFVLSTHRAIHIAKREGHRAEMRAGVSALDVLCADLNVDPSQPGMAMYEATDMLIRQRRPDTGLHIVLWQVGLIGELGYRRQGYINSNFSVLLDYLEDLYGDPDHEVINYVGSRYPGVDPLIDRQTIASLRDPQAQNWVTGISTFYLPPKDVAPSDPQMLERLGLLRPGQTVKDPTSPLRVIDRYGSRERQAFSNFGEFDVPASYQWQEETEPARFILELRDNGDLRDRYYDDPAETVANWAGDLTAKERRMLGQRDAGAMQLAAKGARTRHNPENLRLLNHLIERKAATHGLSRAVGRHDGAQARNAADAWCTKHGFDADWSEVAADFELLSRRRLHPWTGLYLVDCREISLSIHAHASKNRRDRIEVNGERLTDVTFGKGALHWSADDGNASSGYLQADLTVSGRRRFVGVIWPPGELPGSEHKVVAREHRSPERHPLSSMCGTYDAHTGTDQPVQVSILPELDQASGRRAITVRVDGEITDDNLRLDKARVHIGENLSVGVKDRRDDCPPAHLWGEYKARIGLGGRADVHTLAFSESGLRIDGHEIDDLRLDGTAICWSGGPAGFAEGRLSGIIDPLTNHPMLFGDAHTSDGQLRAVRAMVPVPAPDDPDSAPQDSAPQGSAPQGSAPQDSAPQDSAPQDSAPQDSAPQGSAPQDSAHLDSARLDTVDGLPSWAARHVLATMSSTSERGGIFLWHGWDRTFLNLYRIRRVLAQLRGE